MIKTTQENADRIAKEGRIERLSKTNALQLKLREMVQSDEYTKMNKYGETMCYGEMKIDLCLSTFINVCIHCIEKRGTEGILARVKIFSTEELCDFCGVWRKPMECYQLNVSICASCQHRIHVLHRQYQQTGGREGNHPYYKFLVKKHGKEWKDIMLEGVTRRRF